MNCVTLAWSLTGSVLGMQATAVKPPATADAAPVAIVSLCSWPGSRRCTCMSIRPGVTSSPATSTTCADPTGRSAPTATMTPPSMRTSRVPSIPLTGSTTRPPLSSSNPDTFISSGRELPTSKDQLSGRQLESELVVGS